MLHGASPDEAVSARGPIAIRYRSLFWFSHEHDFSRANIYVNVRKVNPDNLSSAMDITDSGTISGYLRPSSISGPMGTIHGSVSIKIRTMRFLLIFLYRLHSILLKTSRENHVMKELKEQFKTIDEYIRTFPEEVQRELEKMKKTIQEAAPEATEAIRYQMPTFRLNGKNLVHFAAFKNHIGFYPIPSGIEAFKKELSPYKQGKGSVQFPLDKPVPYELVKKIVKFRVVEIMKESKSGY